MLIPFSTQYIANYPLAVRNPLKILHLVTDSAFTLSVTQVTGTVNQGLLKYMRIDYNQF